MTYTVNKLITNAYYLSGIVAKDFQTVSGDQINDGLDLLNDLLAFKSTDRRLIPYYSQLVIPCVPGQEMYFIPNLVEVACDTFNLGPVRFQMRRLGREEYFGTPRVDNIQALPFTYHIERTLGGSNIYIYFIPDSNYPLTTTGKFALTQVELGQNLETYYDRFYIVYLRYALAEFICQENVVSFSPENIQKLNEIESKITDISPLDLTINKYSSFVSDGGLNWGYVNLGHGYTTP